MSHRYYQQAQPGWGTNQYQFGAPPTPNFQSQPSWGGMDFYRAHAHSPDPSLFDHAWNRVRDFSGMSGSIGVGINEARHWHRRAYGGIGELSIMLPAEIGHAAAYEAYRTWIHNSSIYEPLSGDIGRQREGLIGLAVAEATRLLPYASRHMDNYARMAASEAAAETASILFYQSREGMGDEYRRSRSRSRYGSGGSSYGGGDPYAYDDALSYPRHRSRSRHRSHSRHRPILQMGGGAYPSPMMSGSFPGGGYASSMPPGVASSYSGQSSYGPYGGGGTSMPMPIHGTPYPASAAPMGMGLSGSYQGAPMDSYSRGRSTSMSYGQTPYMGAAMSGAGGMMGGAGGMMGGGGGMMIPPGVPQTQTIVVKKPRKHKHHHHHSRSRRSRSIEPGYDYRY